MENVIQVRRSSKLEHSTMEQHTFNYMTSVLRSCDKLLVCVCVTGWMTAAVDWNAVCKLYILDQHIVSSVKRLHGDARSSFSYKNKKQIIRLLWIASCYYNVHRSRPGSSLQPDRSSPNISILYVNCLYWYLQLFFHPSILFQSDIIPFLYQNFFINLFYPLSVLCGSLIWLHLVIRYVVKLTVWEVPHFVVSELNYSAFCFLTFTFEYSNRPSVITSPLCVL